MITLAFVRKMANHALDKADGPRQVGESVKGFAYKRYEAKSSDLRHLKSPQLKKALVGERPRKWRFGEFVDTGACDKQIVVSDILPEIGRSKWPKKGDRL